jgi:hypothetical protein
MSSSPATSPAVAPSAPTIPDLFLDDITLPVQDNKISAAFGKLHTSVSELDKSHPRIAMFSARLLDYMHYIYDAGEESPLSPTNIMPISSVALGNRHSKAVLLHPIALRDCHRVFRALRFVFRLFDENLVVMDHSVVVLNVVRALAVPDDLDACIAYCKKSKARIRAPSVTVSVSGLSDDGSSDNDAQPRDDTTLQSRPKPFRT